MQEGDGGDDEQNTEAEDQKDGCGMAGSQVITQSKAHRR